MTQVAAMEVFASGEQAERLCSPLHRQMRPPGALPLLTCVSSCVSVGATVAGAASDCPSVPSPRSTEPHSLRLS